MRPAITVQIINVCLVAVWFLFCHFVLQELRLVMFFTGIQALINLAACLVMLMDSKKKDNSLVYALLIGFGLMTLVTVLVWFLVFNAPAPLPELEVPA